MTDPRVTPTCGPVTPGEGESTEQFRAPTVLQRNEWRPLSTGHLMTSVLGVALVGGVYADGWAHLNTEGLDSFFTPWHGMLYGAFALLMLWVLLLVLHRRRSGIAWGEAVPGGYRTGLVGIGIFALGGLLDMTWHMTLGVETGIGALISPTHLILLTGGITLLLSPFRAWVATRPGSTRVPSSLLIPWYAVLAVAAAAALAAFFVSYLSVFASPGAVTALTTIPEGAAGHTEAEMSTVAGVGGYLIGTVLLVGAYLYARRFGDLPLGGLTVLVAAVAIPGAMLTDLQYAMPALSAVAATALLDLGFAAHRRAIVATTLPGMVWTGQLLGLTASSDVAWPPELWSGIIVLSMLVGFALHLVTAPPPTRTIDQSLSA